MDEEKADYGLKFSFGIDNGELDGISPHQCFVLGFELCQIMHLCEQKHPFFHVFNPLNTERVSRALAYYGVTAAVKDLGEWRLIQATEFDDETWSSAMESSRNGG